MAKNKTPTEGSEHRKKFIECLENIAYRHNAQTVFNDFLAITAISLSNTSDPYFIMTSRAIREKREKRYQDIVNQYSDKERSLFSLMFRELVEELESYCKPESLHMSDFLGELFQTMNFQEDRKAQIFTPQHISNFIGASIIGDGESLKKDIEEKDYISVCDPCCGGGSMIYGLANFIPKVGLNYNKDALFYGVDIDERCVLMTYIQCSLYGLPAIIQQMDALTNESLSEPWFTLMAVLYSWRWRDLYKESTTK